MSYRWLGRPDAPQNNFLFNELALCFDTDYTLFQLKGLGIINAAGVAMGLLTNAGPPKWHPAPDSLRQVCADAGQYCKVRTFFVGGGGRPTETKSHYYFFLINH
jgi:hypothetical protein